jgi:glycosyltransferase involved in cell wall biosynthesis
MKIVIIVPGGVDQSGRERVIPALLWLIERLSFQHSVLVITTNQYPFPSRYSLMGAEVMNLGNISYPIRGMNRINHLVKIVRELKRSFKPDVIHGFWAGTTGLLAVCAGRLLGKPTVISIAGGELVWLPEIGYGRQNSFISRSEVFWTLKGAHRITAGSQFVIQLLKNDLVKSEWIPLGVDTHHLSTSFSRKFGPPWRLIHVGSINRVKNHRMLLESFKLVLEEGIDAYLDCVGEDTLNGELQQLAVQLGLQNRVRFYGFLPLEDIIPLYRRSHLFIQSSWYEAQGVAVCEAAAMGVPTVGTNVGILAELSPQSAVVVPVNDGNALAGAIVRALEDNSFRNELAQNAQVWAHTYNADWTASAFIRIYEDQLSHAGGRL